MDVRYEHQATKKRKRVFFTGSTALIYGQGLSYDRDAVTTETGQTATDPWEQRDNRVEAVDTTNHRRFAGVAAATYAAVTGGQWIEIYEPGSIFEAPILQDVVIDQDVVGCLAGSGAAGYFMKGGMSGRGAALVLETNASGNIGESLDGTAVISTKTITKTGLFASAAVGDKVVILAGSTASGAAGTTPGIYTLATITDDDNAIISEAAPGDGDIAVVVIGASQPRAMVKLLEGEEAGGPSGCIEWISPLDNAAAQSMVGGTTLIFGGITLGAGDSTSTLADGEVDGERKKFVCKGALTTQDWLLTVTSGIQMDGATTLATLEFDAAGDFSLLEWCETEWQLIANVGPTIA